jgi:hypothetical protein
MDDLGLAGAVSAQLVKHPPWESPPAAPHHMLPHLPPGQP